MNKEQLKAAEKAMINWLSNKHELGKEPYKIECTKEFELHEMHYCLFKFKEKMFAEWKLAVCGGYEEDSLEHCGHIFSDFKKYDEKTAINDAIAIVERIRAYWMEKARQQQEFQNKFQANTKFRTQEEIKVEEIEEQFVKTNTRYHLTVGQIDCSTGRIVVCDPLAYLPSGKLSPELAIQVPQGQYNVEISICRQEDIGLRICTAKLKIKDTKVITYKKATATSESVIHLKDGGTLEGFPVDAGMACFCDTSVAKEYQEFIDEWYEKNPDGNHYDDYFAAYFAQSYQEKSAYQREGGDFIEWTNPKTKNKMVMIASGLGDGFYNAYYGFDSNHEISEIILPFVNPNIFGC